jgi:predicted DNA binding CopG/RHH family protein
VATALAPGETQGRLKEGEITWSVRSMALRGHTLSEILAAKLSAQANNQLASTWKPAKGGKRERARYSRYAKATFRKDRRLNIRLSSKDLEAIQKRALAEGLPYQTLIASLLHKYASGRLKEV